MVAIAGIIAAGALIALIEAPSLWKKRQIKELWIFSLLLLTGIGIGIAQSLHVTVPNPIDWISYIYSPIGRMVDNALN
ncbi:hypothetical protein RB620_05030 [Paenibacillus sp. LHD-117]|uniref:hypothetical protein n=1 Tax=Paenibacillus sp. LHD-117 TaxID=3071412 RepID=UPI0027E11C4F|nr:hypothetical protein [Paenibacillus sp. LHD-117]MDQ6418798.1 hypothetical protein [Paenibacillus sp. LHD-117]